MSAHGAREECFRAARHIRCAQMLECDIAEDPEELIVFWGSHYSASALGVALIGKFGNPDTACQVLNEYAGQDVSQFFADQLAISKELVLHIAELHWNGMSVSEIATELS